MCGLDVIFAAARYLGEGDSAEGYRHKGYAVTMAEKLNPNAELVIDES
jgi:hypothetical protein